MTDLPLAGPAARGFASRTGSVALLLFALAPAMVCAAAEERPPSAAIEALKSDFEAIGDQSRADPVAQIDAFEVGPPAADEAGRMHQVMRRFMNSLLVVRNGYLAELDAMGWNAILDADRLRADTDLADSRRLIEQARAVGLRAQAASEKAFHGFEGLVQEAPLRPETKRGMIIGFNQNKARGLAEMRGTFALESETLDQFEAMVELLGRTDWDVEDSQIMFHQDADVDAFNARFHRIQALNSQLEARQQANVKRAQDRLSNPGL